MKNCRGKEVDPVLNTKTNLPRFHVLIEFIPVMIKGEGYSFYQTYVDQIMIL